jgi:hypothetical protein
MNSPWLDIGILIDVCMYIVHTHVCPCCVDSEGLDPMTSQ